MTLEQRRAWIRDRRNDPFRIFAVEIDHRTGTVRFGSQPWMSDELHAYDDWMMSDPEIDDSLDDFLGVGDIDAVNASAREDWTALEFRGYDCRWILGDTRWRRRDFLPVATLRNGGCRRVDGALHTFDLFDGGEILDRRFVEEETSLEMSARDAIDWIVSTAGLPPVTYAGVSSERQGYELSLAVSPDTTIASALADVGRSIGAYTRVSQSGAIEMLSPRLSARPAVTLTEDDIVAGGVRAAEIQQPFRQIVVELADGREISRRSPTPAGQLRERIDYKTLISDGLAGVAFAEERRDYHAVSHTTREIQTLDVTGLIEVGESVAVEHEDFAGSGVVWGIKRSPLTIFSYVEIVT